MTQKTYRCVICSAPVKNRLRFCHRHRQLRCKGCNADLERGFYCAHCKAELKAIKAARRESERLPPSPPRTLTRVCRVLSGGT